MTQPPASQSPTAQQVTVDQDIWLSAADHDYRLRVYRPVTATSGTILVWAHGGAWIGGELEMPEADWVARSIAAAGIAVVSIDYTLAPMLPGPSGEIAPPAADERPRAGYPVSSIQVAAAFDWAVEHATELGGDPDRIGIGGASAGANLAASAAVRLRDAGRHQPSTVILSYPAVHATMPPTPDALGEQLAAVAEEDKIDPTEMPKLAGNYAGDAVGEPYAFPGGHDVSNLPRTLIINAELDTLRPSGEQYAAELALTGCDVRVRYEPDTTHGYLNNPDDPGAPRTIARIVSWLTE